MIQVSAKLCVLCRTCSEKFKIELKKWCALWRSWLKNCARSLKVADSIPDAVNNPSVLVVALGCTQNLTEMSTRNISVGVKAAGVYG
jgi:hypothetical protein